MSNQGSSARTITRTAQTAGPCPASFLRRESHTAIRRMVLALLTGVGWVSQGIGTVARADLVTYRVAGSFGASTIDPFGVVGGSFVLVEVFDTAQPPLQGTNEYALYQSVGGFLQLSGTSVNGVYPSSTLTAVFEFPDDLLQFQVTPIINGTPAVSQIGIRFTAEGPIHGSPPGLPTQFTPQQVQFQPSFLLAVPILAAQLSVTVGPPRTPGDADGDGSVGLRDYTIWAAQFGQSGAGLSADFNLDGVVGAGDYTVWAANFPPPGASGQNVPEPAARVLMLWGLAAVVSLATRRVGRA